MSHYVYIIFSKRLDRFYIGETYEFAQRIEFHNDIIVNSNYTKQGIPWVQYLLIICKERRYARLIESHIKKMKSNTYIQNLKKYPEMLQKLKDKYN